MRWLVALVALVLAGCNPARAFVVTPGEHADYRQVRIAEDAEARLAAAFHYLDEHPDGLYAGRLRRWIRHVEPVFYKVRRRSIAGLRAYLAALPDGPHAEDALARLMMLSDRERREAADLRAFERARGRLDRLAEQRKEAAELPLDWVRMLLRPEAWDGPMSTAPERLVIRYELGLPQPRCELLTDGRRCSKPVEQAYRLVRTGEQIDRSVSFDVRLRFDARGRLVSATLAGPLLFLRSEEARAGEPIDDLDDEALRDAQRAFTQRLTTALLEASFVCEGTSEADGSARLDCEGLRLAIDPGAGGSDRISIAPVEEEPSAL